MPQDNTSGMRSQVRLVSGQDSAEISEVLKFAQFCEWRLAAGGDRYGDCWRTAKQTQKGLVVIIEERRYLTPIEQCEFEGVTADKTVVPPNRDEAGFITL